MTEIGASTVGNVVPHQLRSFFCGCTAQPRSPSHPYSRISNEAVHNVLASWPSYPHLIASPDLLYLLRVRPPGTGGCPTTLQASHHPTPRSYSSTQERNQTGASRPTVPLRVAQGCTTQRGCQLCALTPLPTDPVTRSPPVPQTSGSGGRAIVMPAGEIRIARTRPLQEASRGYQVTYCNYAQNSALPFFLALAGISDVHQRARRWDHQVCPNKTPVS